MPECYKDDVESQGKSLKFDLRHPKTPEPMVTKIGRGEYVPDIYPVENCITIRLGDLPSHMRSCLPNVHSASFFYFWGVLPTRCLLGSCADFDDQYVKRRRFEQGCAFLKFREQIFTF